MSDHSHLEQRVTELEIKSSFQDDLLDQLNQVIVRQQDDIATLARLVSQLREQLPRQPEGGGVTGTPESPPHY